MINPLATELNSVLEGTIADRLMSGLGKRMYFPKGIIAQAAEAKKSAYTANATIGMAYSNNKPLILSAIAESMPALTPEQIVAYAPTAGIETVRQAWKKHIMENNPSLNDEDISLPMVTGGLTSGLSLLAELFMAENQTMITSDPCWDNYTLMFAERRGGILRELPFLGRGPGLDMDAIARTVKEEAAKGSVRIVLNFPNNPAGYSPTTTEAQELAALFLKTAEGGTDILILCDDAYFGLLYEDNVYRESVFSLFANLHPNILAVKIDGPIKEDYVWGLRTGFVTFGSKGLNEKHYAALTTKFMGSIRSSISCANTPAQYIMLKSMEDSRTAKEKASFKGMMQRRYNKVKEFINSNPAHPKLKPLPFNSGYFMSFHCMGISAEKLRMTLLDSHGIGLVAFGDTTIRAAYSALDEEQIIPVYRAIYDCADRL